MLTKFKDIVARSRRSRKVQLQYDEFKATHKGKKCTFCTIGKTALNDIVAEYKHFYVIKNKFPYEIWENSPVIDHLMIIPKEHFYELADMTPSERKTLVEIIGVYESLGYSFYGRSPENTSRSMIHQHTHLIRTTSISTK